MPPPTLSSRRVQAGAVTPAKRNSTNYFFAMSSREGEDLEAAKAYLKPVLDEDVFATVENEKSSSQWMNSRPN